MIKTIIFDLDGVLVDTKMLHFNALNLALRAKGSKYCITIEEHLKIYDGLPTRKKLELLEKNKKLGIAYHGDVMRDKQLFTISLIEQQKFDDKVYNLFVTLIKKGYKIYIATNSIRSTTDLILNKLRVKDIIDGCLTNEDLKYGPKPKPEIYLRTIVESGDSPKECLVLEDSIHGVRAAQDSGANVLVINSLNEVNIDNIMNKINQIDNNISHVKFPFKGNILIPMAGAGSRFEKAGYVFPKPLIETINGKPMIQLVTESLGLDGHFIYLVRSEHLEKYNLQQMLNLITPGCDIVVVDKLTEGACCTTLLAESLINNNSPLIIANSDQYIEWKPDEFMYLMNNQDIDGGILTFENTHPKWSYAKLDSNGYVTEVAEKNPISTNATVGVYYYKQGSDYVKYSKEMINKNIRVNNEFYVAPVFQQFINDGKKIKTFNVDKMIGCGTPEDLNNLINILK